MDSLSFCLKSTRNPWSFSMTIKVLPAFQSTRIASAVLTLAILGSGLSLYSQDAAVAAAPTAQAIVPQTIRYTGTAADRKGDTVEATFRLYAEASGGEPIWQETQTIAVGADGHYAVLLGSQSSDGLPQALFAQGQGRWVSVSIERAPETRRSLLASVAYAMKAADAETLGGEVAGNFVTRAELAARLAETAQSLSTQAAAQSGLRPETSPTGSGTVGAIPLWMSVSTLGSSALTQIGTSIGINTATPATMLDVNGMATLRGNTSLPALGTATASGGFSSPVFSMSGSSFKAGGAAVNQKFGWEVAAVGNNTASPTSELVLLYGAGGAGLTPTGLTILPTGSIFSQSNLTVLSPAATASTGHPSPKVVFEGSAYNSSTSASVAQSFALSALPAANNTANPTANLDLMFGSGSAAPAPTGLSFAPTGIVTFAPGQTFPGTGTLTGLTAGTGLLGGGTTGAVSLKIDPSVVAQLGAANVFTGTQSVNGDLLVSGSGVVSGNQTIFGIGAIQTSTNQAAFVVDNTSPMVGAGISSTGYNAVMGYGNYQGIYGISSAINSGLGPNPAGVFGQGLTGVIGMGTNAGMIASASSATGTGLSATGTAYGVTGLSSTTVATAVGVSGTGTTGMLADGVATGISAIAFGGAGVGVNATAYGGNGIAVNATAGGANGVGVQSSAGGLAVSATSTGAGGIAVAGTGAGQSSTGVYGTGTSYGLFGTGPTALFASGAGYGASVSASNSNGIGVYSSAPYIGVSANASATNGVALWATGTSQTTTAITGHNGTSFSHMAGSMGFFEGAAVWADASRASRTYVPALGATIDGGAAGYFANDSSEDVTLELENDSSGGTIADSTGAVSRGMVPVLQTTGRNGSCVMTGDGDSICTGNHKGAVSITGGSRQVEVYGMQSAESWVEDFGSAKLTHGRATVTIDPTFAETVNTGVEYHVFLTPRGECEGLYVGETAAGTFEVRELHHGASSVEFDYRVVARRRGSEAERLSDITERFKQISEYPRKVKEAAAARAAVEPQLPAAEEPRLPTVLARKH
jgi:trimeric autotransporter adhesin